MGIDGIDLEKIFGFGSAQLLNDFEALAWALPVLHPSDLFPIGKHQTTIGAPMLVVGPGTGFGAACLFRHDAAPTFCARGGVYIAGGIVPRFADHLLASNFRHQFESKGRYEAYLRNIPTNIIVRPDVSFIGLKAFFERNMPVTVVFAAGERP